MVLKGSGFWGNGDSPNKSGWKTPVNGREEREEQYTKMITVFYNKNGKETARGHLNLSGEIAKGPLEIRVSDNMIVVGNKDYTISDYIEAQKKACEERGNGYFYTKNVKGMVRSRMGITNRASQKAIREKRTIEVVAGYQNYSRGN
ncbi:hypothetical protein HYT56_02795 [Candidatus Woesearchaeota archaeon]|nr:hypothetical protein [Candidatus Woesearchaeota archaeon]